MSIRVGSTGVPSGTANSGSAGGGTSVASSGGTTAGGGTREGGTSSSSTTATEPPANLGVRAGSHALTRGSLIETYTERVAERTARTGTAHDETGPDGVVGDSALWDHLESLGVNGLNARRREIDRLARDERIGGTGRSRWRVDPIPLVFDAGHWADLQEGLEQRARLLDAILTDLYGERRLLRRDLLPADLFLGHDGYLLPAHGITIPGPRQLPVAGTDLVRGPDGWLVVTDRTQAPAGIGYALANRRLVTRVMEPLFRVTRSSRLRGFFDVMQIALQRAAPPGITSPRVVLYSPGPASETSYDQALVATLLGHPLVVADDLVVRDGSVWLRTPGRPQRVDVIQRRVDGEWSDPLDLRPDSQLGVAGLVAAARRGTVSVVNPIGSGALENVGMAPYLNRVSRELMGEDLRLAAPETWWCGDPVSRSHVLANMEQLVIRPTSRTERPTSIAGWELDAAARDELRRRIEAEPWAWAGQVQVESSTVPVVTPQGLSPRAMVLRTFRIALDDEYVVMPGGLAKVAATEDEVLVHRSAGVLAKDVWVLESAQVPVWRSLQAAASSPVGVAVMPDLTPRAAGDLYWMGRYAERLEAAARMVGVGDNLVDDQLTRPGSAGHTAMDVIMEAIGEVTGVRLDPEAGPDEESRYSDQLTRLMVDVDLPGSVAFAARRTSENALAVRELLAPETVRVLGGLTEMLAEIRDAGGLMDHQSVATRVLSSALALAGIAGESLVRDSIWTFMDAGRRLERAQATVGMLRSTLANAHSPVAEAVIVEMVLRAGDTLITYRRRMSAGVGSTVPAVAAIELLLEDPRNPRSVRYQLDRLLLHFDSGHDAALRSYIAETRALVIEPDHDALFAGAREGLAELLAMLDRRLRELAHAVERTHFAPQRPSRAFAVEERSVAGGAGAGVGGRAGPGPEAGTVGGADAGAAGRRRGESRP